MRPLFFLLVFVSFLIGCGGGGGGDGGSVGGSVGGGGGSSESNANASVEPYFRIGFDEFDRQLAALQDSYVSSDSPDGTWILYATGSVDTLVANSAGSGSRDIEVEFYARNFSMRVGGGVTEFFKCSRGITDEDDVTTPFSSSDNRFELSMDQINDFLPVIFEQATLIFNDLTSPADARPLIGENTPISATIIDNREIVFDQAFTLLDDEGEFTAESVFTLKARKISDQFDDTIGEIELNSVSHDLKCLDIRSKQVSITIETTQLETYEEIRYDFDFTVTTSVPDTTFPVDSVIFVYSEVVAEELSNVGNAEGWRQLNQRGTRVLDTTSTTTTNIASYRTLFDGARVEPVDDKVDRELSTSADTGLPNQFTFDIFETSSGVSQAGTISLDIPIGSN